MGGEPAKEKLRRLVSGELAIGERIQALSEGLGEDEGDFVDPRRREVEPPAEETLDELERFLRGPIAMAKGLRRKRRVVREAFELPPQDRLSLAHHHRARHQIPDPLEARV